MVEGPLGAGKHAFARGWAERHGVRQARVASEANPFLAEALGSQPGPQTFSATMVALLARHEMQDELRQADLFAPGVVAVGSFERELVFAELLLVEPELSLHRRIYGALAGRAVEPDLLVVLRPRPEAVLARLRVRAVQAERGLDPGRLESLCHGFVRHFDAARSGRTVILDLGDADLGEDDTALGRALDGVERAREAAGPGRWVRRVDREG